MNSFYVSGCIICNKFGYEYSFDEVVRTEKSRLSEFEINDIKNRRKGSDDSEVVIHLIYKLED